MEVTQVGARCHLERFEAELGDFASLPVLPAPDAETAVGMIEPCPNGPPRECLEHIRKCDDGRTNELFANANGPNVGQVTSNASWIWRCRHLHEHRPTSFPRSRGWSPTLIPNT